MAEVSFPVLVSPANTKEKETSASRVFFLNCLSCSTDCYLSVTKKFQIRNSNDLKIIYCIHSSVFLWILTPPDLGLSLLNDGEGEGVVGRGAEAVMRALAFHQCVVGSIF